MKVCSKCGEAKPLEQFSPHKRSPNGIRANCKACGSAAAREWYRANREAVLAKHKADYAEDPQKFIACVRAAQDRKPEVAAAWRARNRERINAQQMARRDPVVASVRFRAWYAVNREEQVARALAWAQANPERRRATQQRRIARKASAPGAEYTTAELIESRVAVYGGCCYYCGAHGAETIDHRIPLARGGTHWPANLVPSCGSCNFRKGTKTESEFLDLLEREEVKPSHHDRTYAPALV